MVKLYQPAATDLASSLDETRFRAAAPVAKDRALKKVLGLQPGKVNLNATMPVRSRNKANGSINNTKTFGTELSLDQKSFDMKSDGLTEDDQ